MDGNAAPEGGRTGAVGPTPTKAVGTSPWTDPMRGIGRPEILARYVIVVIFCSLAWESLQMPLYTIWQTATALEQAADVVQCTGANVVIALSSLVLAIAVARNGSIALRRYAAVGVLASVFAVAYTVLSEWLNVHVWHVWAYSDLMPMLPGTELGLSPIVQWIVIPLAGFWWAHRRHSTTA